MPAAFADLFTMARLNPVSRGIRSADPLVRPIPIHKIETHAMTAQPQGMPLSRRELFGRLFQPFRAAALPDAPPATDAPAAPAMETIAVIAGRHCLAYQGTGCSVCVERCPIPGALVLAQGFPRVVPDVCTGCRVCHDVCPAPENAVRIVPRPPGLKKRTSDTPVASSPFPHLPGGEKRCD